MDLPQYPNMVIIYCRFLYFVSFCIALYITTSMFLSGKINSVLNY